MYYVYILKCADGSLYTGSTNDIEKRLHAHNHTEGGAKYTKARRPVELVYQEECGTKSESLVREAKIKSMKRGEKVELTKKCLPKYFELQNSLYSPK